MKPVLDSSVTLAFIYDDENNQAVRELFEQVVLNGAIVPNLWRLEVANALLMGTRRGRIDVAFRDMALADLARMPISIDPDTDPFAWTNTLHLAERFRLTVYDACYLELARRRSLPLATMDKELRAAAEKAGVALLGA